MLHRRAWVVLASLLTLPAWAANYALDPRRTVPQFEIDHLWLFTERGHFSRVHGTLEYDVDRRAGDLQVVIDAASLDTGNEERNVVLRGAGWFDVDRFPTLTFRSRRFVFAHDRLVAVDGELTMLGVARPLTLEIVRIECAPGSATHCVADARGTLQRSRYGMRSGLPFIGDEVRLRIQAVTYADN